MEHPYSPFDGSKKAKVLKNIKTTEIIRAYEKLYGIDVAGQFKNLEEVFLCECPLTGLRFYFPFGCAGDPRFYAELSKNSWYYNPERWEHRALLPAVADGSRVLEIGAGDGVFSQLLSGKQNVHYTGLEYNPEAIKKAQAKGIDLRAESLSTHLKEHEAVYDVLCSFQVMEHVSDISTMLSDSVRALKKQGKLIIAVPNNEVDFVNVLTNVHPSKYLNMPPHHVNLFNEKALRGLTRLFPLELLELIREPLQDIHVDVYLYNRMAKLFAGSSFLMNLFWRTKIPLLFRSFVKRRSKGITGHTIIAIYKKT